MKHAILLTHGLIGEAFIEAVQGIMGLDDGLHAISVMNMSVVEITDRLMALVGAPEEKRDGVIILASLKGGSCWNVAVSVAKDNSNVEVVSGLNLSMVLSFMTKRDELPLNELAENIEQDGHRGVTLFKNSQR